MRTQSLAKLCTAIFTVYFVSHRPSPCAIAIHKTCTDQLWDRHQDSARTQDQRSMCWQHTKHLDRRADNDISKSLHYLLFTSQTPLLRKASPYLSAVYVYESKNDDD